MTTLIFGSKGYIGSQFLELFPDSIGSTADITNADSVAAQLDEHRPDVVINAAGKTGKPNVDWCEDHKLETLRSNVTGPLVLLDECAKRNIYWVNIGTGCIYQGDNEGRGYSEEDPPNFFGSYYSRTKASIDQILKEYPMLQLRIRMPFGSAPASASASAGRQGKPFDGSESDRDLITKLLRFPKVLDVPNSMTYLPDFFTAAKTLIEKRKTGVFNVVNPGTYSPYDVMVQYQKEVDSSHKFERLTLDDLPGVVVAGRSNCILNISKLEGEGIVMRPIEDAVDVVLHTRNAHNNASVE